LKARVGLERRVDPGVTAEVQTPSSAQSPQTPAAPSISPALPESVCTASELAEGGRLHIRVQGRYVTVLRLGGRLFCIDSVCYHAGGPLGSGDIEEVNGKSCLVCPWHNYQVDIATGDKYYQQMKFVDGKMVEGEWASNGIKQRTHTVTEDEGAIWVTLSSDPLQIESDTYGFNAPCGERVRTQAGKSARMHSVGADGKKPSGAIMRAAREAAHAVSTDSKLGPKPSSIVPVKPS